MTSQPTVTTLRGTIREQLFASARVVIGSVWGENQMARLSSYDPKALGLAECQWCDGDGCEFCAQTGTVILYRESQYNTAKEVGILIWDLRNAARA